MPSCIILYANPKAEPAQWLVFVTKTCDLATSHRPDVGIRFQRLPRCFNCSRLREQMVINRDCFEDRYCLHQTCACRTPVCENVRNNRVFLGNGKYPSTAIFSHFSYHVATPVQHCNSSQSLLGGSQSLPLKDQRFRDLRHYITCTPP